MKVQEVHLFTRLTCSIRTLAARLNDRSTTFHGVVRETLSGVLKTGYHAITVIGLAALATSAVMFYSPTLASQLKSQLTALVEPNSTSSVTTKSVPMDMPAAVLTSDRAYLPHSSGLDLQVKPSPSKFGGDQRQQQWVTSWISKRYRVAADATDMLVSAAYATSSEIKLDPLLILAVVAIESGFNPFAESAVGAQGLMQVMAKIHHERFQKLGGVKAALNPVANIKVGSSILKEYVSRGGSVEAGLKMYVGAAAFDNDAGYGSKVLAEYRRLKEVAAGRSVPVITTPIQITARAPQKSMTNVVASPQAAPATDEKPLLPEARRNPSSDEKIAEM